MSETVEYPPATEQDSHLLTVLIADIRGYSTYTHEHGDEAGARLASCFADLAADVISTSGGTLLELRGDEALAVFPSARRAARAAVELQARCTEAGERDPSLPLRVGVGLDAGEVVPVGAGYRGRALNVAARLCALAKPGEILVGEGLVHIAGVVDGLAFVSRGRTQLKGIERVRVFQLGREGELPEHLPPVTGGKSSQPKSPSLPASAILAIVAAGFGLAAILIELLFSTYTTGLVGIVIAGLACVAAFASARPIAGQEIHGVALLYLIIAFALVFTLRWWAAVSAVLFLIAAGMAFFGDGSSSPSSPPPG